MAAATVLLGVAAVLLHSPDSRPTAAQLSSPVRGVWEVRWKGWMQLLGRLSDAAAADPAAALVP